MKTQRIKNNEINVSNFDNVTVNNLNAEIVKTVKTKKATNNKSAVTLKLESLNYENSNKLAKAVKSIDFLFSSIRSIILALIANNQSLNIFDKNSLVAILRKSKKDVQLYITLRKLAGFTYKAVKTTEKEITTLNIVKAFSVKSVLQACTVFEQINSVELTENLIQSILHEHELNAVKQVEKSIETAQNTCNDLTNLIESLKDSAKVEKQDLTEKLELAEKQLLLKIRIFDYVKIQSNRNLIK